MSLLNLRILSVRTTAVSLYLEIQMLIGEFIEVKNIGRQWLTNETTIGDKIHRFESLS